jgi:hypothetical protein
MHLFHRDLEMATFCEYPFALPHSYGIGELEWVASVLKHQLVHSRSVHIRLWRNKPTTVIINMDVPLTIFEISAPKCDILLSHYAIMLKPLTSGGKISVVETFSAYQSQTTLRNSLQRMFIVAVIVHTSTYPLKRSVWLTDSCSTCRPSNKCHILLTNKKLNCKKIYGQLILITDYDP